MQRNREGTHEQATGQGRDRDGGGVGDWRGNRQAFRRRGCAARDLRRAGRQARGRRGEHKQRARGKGLRRHPSGRLPGHRHRGRLPAGGRALWWPGHHVQQRRHRTQRGQRARLPRRGLRPDHGDQSEGRLARHEVFSSAAGTEGGRLDHLHLVDRRAGRALRHRRLLRLQGAA